MKLRPALALALLTAAPAWASAQERHDASGALVPDRRGNDEFIALMLTAGSYGFRSGTMLNYALDLRQGDGGWTYWLAPTLLGAAGIAGALILESRSTMRRGRGLTAGTSMLLAQVGTLAFEMQRRGESYPSSATLTSPVSWVGATVGLAGGIALGHFLDVAPGKAVYVGVGGVGGAIVGLFSCGIAQCSADVGAWALTGMGVGLVATLATASWLNPPQREVRSMVSGGVGGLVPAAGVLLAYYTRDGSVSQAAWARVSVVGLVGALLGGGFGYALARSSRGAAAREGGSSLTLMPTFERNGPATTVAIGAFGTM